MINIGARVRYIREDTEGDKMTGYYPPVGALGTLVDIDTDYELYHIKWDEGTRDEGVWWCEYKDVELVFDPMQDEAIKAMRIYLKDGHEPMVELVTTSGKVIRASWDHVIEREYYSKYMNAYTLIYDERPKVAFSKLIGYEN